MPLRFLVPVFLVGLSALVIPILVHLTRKQRAQVVEFPSLMFLEQVPFKDESRRTIQHWLLLLLRALAVVLVVAAFARPFLQDAEVLAGTGGGPREVVVLLDRSYSMGIEDRWDEARTAAREVFQGLGPLDRASLVTFARNAGVAVRSSGQADRLLSALDTLDVSDEATRYGPGLKLAQTILEETDLPGRELVMIGDFQRAGWTGDEGIRLPAETVVNPVSLASEVGENRAVAEVTLHRQRMGARDRVTPAARLTRVGGEAEETVEVVLDLEGYELQTKSVVLPPTGAALVAFDPFNVSEAHTRGTVRFATSDVVAPDDGHHFVVSPGQAISVVVLNEGGSRGASSFYFTEALSISEESAFDVSSRTSGTMDPGSLDGVSVVVVNDRPVPGGASAETVREFVEDGGGLLVILGERIRWPAELADLLPGAFTGPVDRADGRGGRLGYLDYDHPVFEVFRGPRSGDFTGVRFFRARDLQVVEDGSSRILARFDDGSVALAEKRIGEGRVLIWTSTLDVFWNDLARHPVYLPFVHQLVRYASGRAETVPAFLAGQVLDVTDARAMATAGLGEVAEALAGADQRIALTPSGESLDLPTGEGPHFLHLDEQGIYEVRPPGESEVRPLAVAVNVDLTEADLTPLDVEEVVASIAFRSGEGAEGRAEGAQAARLRLEDQERRQSLWRFLLAGAFMLLAAETLISNRLSKVAGRGVSNA